MTKTRRRLFLFRHEEEEESGVEYLSDIDGGDAYACYGLLYNASYSGNAFTLRRTSDNNTLDVPYNTTTMLPDTSGIASFCSGTTCVVTDWYDTVGSRDHVRATATDQPTMYESGTLKQVGNFPAMFFDNTDRLSTAANFGITGSTKRTLLVAVNRTARTAAEVMWSLSSVSSPGAEYQWTPELGIRINSGFSVTTETNTGTDELDVLILTGTNVTDHTHRRNGSGVSVTSSSSRTVNTGASVSTIGNKAGGSSPSDADTGFAIVYDTDKTSTISTIESKINSIGSVY